MRFPSTKIILLAVVIALLLCSSVAPQPANRTLGRVTTRLQYYRWSVDDSIGNAIFSQTAIPINGVLKPTEDTEVRFSISGSTNRYNAVTGDRAYLDGIGDIRLQGSRMFFDRGLLISGGVNFPTGKRSLSYASDTTIINLLSQNYLVFPQRRFGRGWGFNGLVGIAHVIGYARMSAGVMYEYAGAYTPYQELLKYDPGDVFSLTLSFDWQRDRLLLFGDALGSIFTNDTYDGLDAIKQSPQLTLRIGGVGRIGDNETGVSMRFVLRGNHELFTNDSTVSYETKLYGNEIHVTGYVRHNYESGMHVAPVFELRYVKDNTAQEELAQGESMLFGLGSGIGQRLSDRMSITLDGRYYFGKADAEQLDLTGFQVTASLTSTF